jgi:hypothetical protein
MSAPAAIDGNTTPKHAYLLGYLDALQALTDAFQVKAKKKAGDNPIVRTSDNQIAPLDDLGLDRRQGLDERAH